MITKTNKDLAEFLGVEEFDLVTVANLPHESHYDRDVYKVIQVNDDRGEPFLVLKNTLTTTIRELPFLLTKNYEVDSRRAKYVESFTWLNTYATNFEKLVNRGWNHSTIIGIACNTLRLYNMVDEAEQLDLAYQVSCSYVGVEPWKGEVE